MHPSIRQAYEQRTHPLINHPIHGVYGQDLAKASYDFIKQKYSQTTGSEQLQWHRLGQLMHSIERFERDHKEELEAIAVEAAKKLWGITNEINFNADMVDDQEEFDLSDYEPEEPEGELTDEDKKEIDKRITLNIMMHGAAQHQMLTMHHLVMDELNNIDRRLGSLYDEVARTLEYSNWHVPLEAVLAAMGQQQGGEVSIKWPEDEDGDEDGDEGGGPITVNAKATIFPILVHELSKGVMEILMAHGIPQDPELWKKVKKHADRPEHEFFHFLVGPEIWRRFLKVIGKKRLPDVISALSTQEPDAVHKIIGTIVDNPEDAQGLIDQLVAEEEPEAESEEELDGLEGIDWSSLEEGKMKKKKAKTKMEQIAEFLTDDPDVLNEYPAPAAPTKPAPAPPKEKPKPKTNPSETPKKKPGQNPFRPPKPAEEPGPKAKKDEEED